MKNIIGKTFNNWKVIKLFQKTSNGITAKYECECLKCHRHYIVAWQSMKDGRSKQCRKCSCVESGIKRKKAPCQRLKNIYKGIKQRCYNQNSTEYKLYGYRGIRVCDEWKDDSSTFYKWALANGYDDTKTIDRIDCDGNYEPSNCRWTNVYTQNNNKKTNVIVEIDGKKQTLQQWCDELQIHRPTIDARIRKGMNIIEALKKPINHNKNNRKNYGGYKRL